MRSRLVALIEKESQRGRFSGIAALFDKDESGLEIHACGVADVTTGAANGALTVVPIASLSKLFTAIAALRLYDRGALDLDAPIGRYLGAITELLPSWADSVSARHLLNHTAGLPSFFQPHAELAAVPEGYLSPAQPIAIDIFLRAICRLPLRFSPGTRFEYGNSGYALLAAIIEQVADLPYSDFVTREVLAPAGLTATSVCGFGNATRAIGHFANRPAEAVHPSWLRGAGEYESTARDLINLSRAVHGEALLSAQARRLLFGDVDGAIDHSGGVWGFGFRRGGLHIGEGHAQRHWQDGLLPGIAVLLSHDLQSDRAVALLCNHLPSALHGRAALRNLHRLASELLRPSLDAPKPTSEPLISTLTRAVSDRGALRYAIDESREVRIDRRDSELWASAEGAQPFTLVGLTQQLSEQAVLARTRAVQFLRAKLGAAIAVTPIQNEGSRLVVCRCAAIQGSLTPSLKEPLDAHVHLDGDAGVVGYYLHPKGAPPAALQMRLFDDGPQTLRGDGYPHATEDVRLQLFAGDEPPRALTLRSDDERSESVRAFLVQSR